MAPPRVEIVGATYHVNGKGGRWRRSFSSTSATASVPRSARRAGRARATGALLAYTLMTTHYHLLFRLEKLTLSSGFQRLNSRLCATLQQTPRPARRSLAAAVLRHDHRERRGICSRAIRYIAFNAPRAHACDATPKIGPGADYGAAIGARAAGSARRRARAAQALRERAGRGASSDAAMVRGGSAIRGSASGQTRVGLVVRRREVRPPRREASRSSRRSCRPASGCSPSNVVQRPPASSTRSCTGA